MDFIWYWTQNSKRTVYMSKLKHETLLQNFNNTVPNTHSGQRGKGLVGKGQQQLGIHSLEQNITSNLQNRHFQKTPTLCCTTRNGSVIGFESAARGMQL
jgi:hypothetical protein